MMDIGSPDLERTQIQIVSALLDMAKNFCCMTCLDVPEADNLGNAVPHGTWLWPQARRGQTPPYPAQGLGHWGGGRCYILSLSGGAAMVGDSPGQHAPQPASGAGFADGTFRGRCRRRDWLVAGAAICAGSFRQRNTADQVGGARGGRLALVARPAGEVFRGLGQHRRRPGAGTRGTDDPNWRSDGPYGVKVVSGSTRGRGAQGAD